MGRKRAATGTKSSHVREYLSQNADAAPKEVKAALAEQGVVVSEALVSKIKYSDRGNGRRRGRRKKKTAVGTVRTAGRRGGAAVVNADELITTKRFVDEMGSIDKARKALDLLEKLL